MKSCRSCHWSKKRGNLTETVRQRMKKKMMTMKRKRKRTRHWSRRSRNGMERREW